MLRKSIPEHDAASTFHSQLWSYLTSATSSTCLLPPSQANQNSYGFLFRAAIGPFIALFVHLVSVDRWPCDEVVT